MEDKYTPQTWQELLGQIIEDPQVKQRIARETRVKTITLTRWVHNLAKPREDNMRQLLKAIPREHHLVFSRLAMIDFPNFSHDAGSSDPRQDEPPSEFYARVLSAYANTPQPLHTQGMYDLLFQQSIEQLDPDRQGMSISVVCCMHPLYGDKVRSLREIIGTGTPPWSHDLQHKTVFLGAESLAGAAVTKGRYVVAQSRKEPETYSLFFAHWSEHEQSAVAYPITCRARVIGCLLVSSTVPHYFTDRHLALIERYAHLMALAFDPRDFFAPEDIALRWMPHYTKQEPYVRHFNRRVTQKFADANAERRLITLNEAQERAWQDIEEELLQLPPYTELE
ncbi:MAG TPA: GAF domain-containing protein [Ktedonosporobacter sp.]|nr:GAF domain-containing protein [Ktedonosporobacter sp.]